MSDQELLGVEIADDGSLRVKGELDFAGTKYLEAALHAATDAATGDVVVDLSDVTFIDSSGLHALADVHRRLLAAKRALRIVTPSSCVIRILEISGLTGYFASAPSGIGPAAN